MRDPASCIGKTDRHVRSVTRCRHRHLLTAALLHGALAVLGEVQKHLHQALPVGPDRGNIVVDPPLHGHTVVEQRALDDNAQLIEKAAYIRGRRLARCLLQVHRRNPFKR
jgi:hypothetical protein